MKRISLLRGNNAKAYMKYLKSIGIPFEMICSNYTVLYKADGLEKKFVHSMQSNRIFACFAKLKSDCKKKPPPEIDMNKLSYYVHNFKDNIYIGDVINVDLKSAYATVLLLDGYITKKTFDYVCKGSKQDRLVSVGMLASKKQHFHFDKGIIVEDPHEVVSEYSNYFYYAVKRVGEIMDNLKMICGSDYLFTWVDGIYMHPNADTARRCEEYIKSIGFKSTVEKLREFEVKIGSKKVTVEFEKKVKGEWKRKPFNLPLPNSDFKKLILEAILSRNKTK